MEQTLYRKYRPDRFSELAGQEHIKLLFSRSLQEGNYSHAYIFAGPRGTGKTTVARIIAKRLNCLDPDGNEPCNVCDECSSISNGSHLDVIEMDAASNRGIDDFRAIRDRVAYRPAQGKVKVYIIDEVHMLTNEAFNAILKTLEEPPDHVVFILATTNPEKIPETILSRCQIIPFRNVTVNAIKAHIEIIAEKEGYTLAQDVITYMAKRAKGGMRDAVVLLEQVLRFLPKDKPIKKDDVLEVLGGVREEKFSEFIKLIGKGDVGQIIDFSEDLYNNGTNFEVFLAELTDYILETLAENDVENQRQYLSIAKKASEIQKQIRYTDTPNVVFSVEFLAFVQDHYKHPPTLKADMKTEPAKPINREKVEPLKIKPVEKKETPIKAEKRPDQDLDFKMPEHDFLEELKEKEMDLYIALHFLKNEINDDGFLTITKDKKYPFSNYVIEKGEKKLRDIIEAKSLKLGINEYKKEIQAEKIDIPKNIDVPNEIRGVYDKIKKLFPESDIVIKEK